MTAFRGKMQLLADPGGPVGADIEVTEGSLALIVSDHEVGEWPLAEVAIGVTIEGFHVRVEGEEFVFSTPESAAFARAVGVSPHPGKSRPRRGGEPAGERRRPGRPRPADPPARAPGRQARTPAATRPAALEAIRRRVPRWALGPRLRALVNGIDFSDRRTRLSALAVLAGAAMAIFARSALAGLLVATGLVGLVMAGAALVDPLLAARMPAAWTAPRMLRVALASVAGGLFLLAF